MRTTVLAFLLMSVCFWGLSSIAAAEQVSTADLNGDGTINLGDISIIASRWLNSCSCSGLQCGDDGCGGSCGTCGTNYICDNGNCILLCDHVGFESLGGETASHDSGLQLLYYQADSNSSSPLDYLTIEIYQSLGGPTSTGSYPIPDENYETTNLAVLVYYNCDGGCEKTFLANSGTIDISSIGTSGGQFTGTLSDVELIEVTIDPTTYVSTPVPAGEDWCISGYQFDVGID